MPDFSSFIGKNPSTSTNTFGRISLKTQLFLKNNGTYAKDGLSSAGAGTSAAQLKADYGYNTDGVYWINLPTAGPTQVYCLMNNQWNGGGWMMAMKATTGTTFNYSANYWTTYNTLNPTDVTRNNADAKYDVMNYFAAKDMLAVWPDITTGTGGSITGLGVWTWLQNNYYRGGRMSWVDFNNIASDYLTTDQSGAYGVSANPYGGYFLGDAKSFSGWASGIFSSQVDIRFYGYNFNNFYNSTYGITARVRWGFGWNENGEGLYQGASSIGRGVANATTGPSKSGAPGSDDVSGGIGMDSTYGSYSAGDKISCCNDTTGINRSARVEVYVR